MDAAWPSGRTPLGQLMDQLQVGRADRGAAQIAALHMLDSFIKGCARAHNHARTYAHVYTSRLAS